MLGVLVTSGLVLAFGGTALRQAAQGARARARARARRGRSASGDEKLARAERVATMGTFAMGIAHEVSTPLGVIVGRAEQLLGGSRATNARSRNAQAILEQAERIQQIVRRFLDMARGGPPSLERTDPSDVARAAARRSSTASPKAQRRRSRPTSRRRCRHPVRPRPARAGDRQPAAQRLRSLPARRARRGRGARGRRAAWPSS